MGKIVFHAPKIHILTLIYWDVGNALQIQLINRSWKNVFWILQNRQLTLQILQTLFTQGTVPVNCKQNMTDKKKVE